MKFLAFSQTKFGSSFDKTRARACGASVISLLSSFVFSVPPSVRRKVFGGSNNNEAVCRINSAKQAGKIYLFVFCILQTPDFLSSFFADEYATRGSCPRHEPRATPYPQQKKLIRQLPIVSWVCFIILKLLAFHQYNFYLLLNPQ